MSGGRKFTSVSDSNLREVALTWSTDFLRFWCLNHIRPNSISNMLHLQILCRLPIASETRQVIEGQGEEIARRLLKLLGSIWYQSTHRPCQPSTTRVISVQQDTALLNHWQQAPYIVMNHVNNRQSISNKHIGNTPYILHPMDKV